MMNTQNYITVASLLWESIYSSYFIGKPSSQATPRGINADSIVKFHSDNTIIKKMAVISICYKNSGCSKNAFAKQCKICNYILHNFNLNRNIHGAIWDKLRIAKEFIDLKKEKFETLIHNSLLRSSNRGTNIIINISEEINNFFAEKEETKDLMTTEINNQNEISHREQQQQVSDFSSPTNNTISSTTYSLDKDGKIYKAVLTKRKIEENSDEHKEIIKQILAGNISNLKIEIKSI